MSCFGSFPTKTLVPPSEISIYVVWHCFGVYLLFYIITLHTLNNGRQGLKEVTSRGMRLPAHTGTTAVNQGMRHKLRQMPKKQQILRWEYLLTLRRLHVLIARVLVSAATPNVTF